MQIIELNEANKAELKKTLEKRSTNHFADIEARVNDIIANVRENKDAALFDYSEKFDHYHLTSDNIRVADDEIKEAVASVDPEFLRILQKAAENIRNFHEKQRRLSWIDTQADGTILGQKFTPLEIVGVYVPGGKAAYPSSLLMSVVTAKVAGVERIVMLTPPGQGGEVSRETLAAAYVAGVDEIYRVGGAQAIAAMAYGTESIPKVHKICGPGNIYVALAKKAVYGQVSIDSVAGPSEILVLADETADPKYVAADLLSQAEHDEMASAILVTTSAKLAEQVSAEIDQMVPKLERKAIIEKSLEQFGFIFVAGDMDSAIAAVNDIASEHLEIITEDAMQVMTKVRNAGAIFVGPYSSEPLGDYFAGPNHILPTNGTAKFFSPLNVDDFVKKTSIISYSREALERDYKDIMFFANKEGLTAHANSIGVRFE
ncbi:MAG: histidinol dehydrogenase [Lachnospiraceae bacterium]|nr:histidinol dehydrogenase [Lachnospiraceae bacterium]MBR6157249.1 histidinol dehydrogenase [Lachnospiraceae bacterium]